MLSEKSGKWLGDKKLSVVEHFLPFKKSLKLKKEIPYNLKIRNSDNAIFDSDKPKEDAFMGYYNEDTTEIVAEIEESEDDGFSSDDMKDTEQF